MEDTAGRYGQNYGPICGRDDIIEMYLNMDKLELSFRVNKTTKGEHSV